MPNNRTSKLSVNEALQILELPCGAEPEEIKRSYRDLARVWHPDRFEHDPKLQVKAGEKLGEINLAYEALEEYLADSEQASPVVLALPGKKGLPIPGVRTVCVIFLALVGLAIFGYSKLFSNPDYRYITPECEENPELEEKGITDKPCVQSAHPEIAN